MVIKYETCSYSGYKIAPGHGLRYCEVNGKTHTFINKKNHRLFLHGKKPLNIRWNLKWRTAHKKGKTEETKKKVEKQKKVRQVKAIVGLSVEEITKIQESFKDSKQADAQRYKYSDGLLQKLSLPTTDFLNLQENEEQESKNKDEEESKEKDKEKDGITFVAFIPRIKKDRHDS